MKLFRRATENNSLIPAIVSALSYYPEVMAFPVKGEGARGKRLVVPQGTADILGVKHIGTVSRSLVGQLVGFPSARPSVSTSQSELGQAFAIETKLSHGVNCQRKACSCAAQRLWRVEWEKRGGLYILARTPQEAIDGLMGRRAA